MIWFVSVGTQETFEALGRFLFFGGYVMKEYKNSNELLNYIILKGVLVNDKEDALNKIKAYSYYSIINTYKDVFKNINNEYKKNVSFDEIYSLFVFDKNLRSIFLKYLLEI